MDKYQSTKDFEAYINAHENSELQITSSIKYKIRDVIDKNDELFHGKFEQPKDGTFTKIFYNIGFSIFRTIYMVVSASIGTKDIQLTSTNGEGIEVLALLRLAIHSYLKRIKFGTFLNDLCYFLKDGTTVVKIVDGQPKIVSNHNLVRPAYGEGIQETGVAERCTYSWSEMQSHKEDWKDSWAQIEKLKSKMDEEKVSDFIIYEYWNEHDFEEKGIHKGCIKYLDITNTNANDRAINPNPTGWTPFIELERFITPHTRKRTSKRMSAKLGNKEELYPYKELHFIKVPGRTLGFSIFELIAGIQEAYNRKMNLHDKKDILDLMGVFKHKKNASSPSVAQQLLNNIESGTVIEMEIDEDLERLIIDTKTGELIASVDKLFELARQIVGVTAQATGIDMPATTTATIGILNKQTQKTTYDFAAEQLSIFLTELFDDFFLETILDEMTSEDWNLIMGDVTELKEIDRYLVEGAVKEKSIKRYTELEKMQGDVSWEQIQMLEDLETAEIESLCVELEKKGSNRWAQLSKELLKNLNYIFEFYVNNESFDKNVKIQNMLTLRANTDLSTKRIDMTLMDLMGENPKQFEKTEQEKQEEMQILKEKTAIENPQVPTAMPDSTSFINANPIAV